MIDFASFRLLALTYVLLVVVSHTAAAPRALPASFTTIATLLLLLVLFIDGWVVYTDRRALSDLTSFGRARRPE